MLSDDELRELADALEPMAAAPRFDGLPVTEFCAWLRQCAEQRPVAYKHTESDGGMTYFVADEAPCEKCVPLYAAPVPPQREPVSDSRPCTCHPDDNPPVPCAQKYALSECRAASEPTIDLDALSWASIKQAASESKWIPPEYTANDWVSDVCAFLRGREGEPTEAQRLEGATYGIIDPDYGRVYTIARKLAWEEGYAIGLHGSFTRDLDMIAVPWTDSACEPEHLIRRIVDATGLKLRREPSSKKPHGRLAWSLHFPAFGDPRFVDLSVMPSVNKPTEAQIEAATDAWQAHCGLLLLSREGARDEVLIVLRAALAAKETK